MAETSHNPRRTLVMVRVAASYSAGVEEAVRITFIAALACAIALPGAQPQARQEVSLQKAIQTEMVDGNLKSAIEMYTKLAQSRDRAVAAQALVRMGECYAKLGDAEARKAFERVVREFGDQREFTQTARARLAALGRPAQSTEITLRRVWAARNGWMNAFTGSPSADGRYHTFADNETGNLAVRDLITGQNRRITNQGDSRDYEEFAEASVISSDGKQVAYAWYKEGYYEVRVCGMDGSNPRTVYRDREFGDWLEPYQWTPDGKLILVALMNEKSKEHRIALIPAAGGPARILPTRAPRPWYPSLSPDGRFVAYSSPTQTDGGGAGIFLLALEGGREDSIVGKPYDAWAPVWTPDGKGVLFISKRTGSNGIWTIDVVEGKARGVPRLLKDGLDQEIRPNGLTRQGAFYFSASTSVVDVYVAELDQTFREVVREPAPILPRLTGTSSSPSWSPDGRRLAYYSRPKSEEPPTLVIHSVGTDEVREVPIRLERARHPLPAPWFPDGKSVLVCAYDTPAKDQLAFYRVDVQTGQHRLIRGSPGHGPITAALSPDGRTIYFFTGGEQKAWGGIIKRDIETGQEREIARVPYMLPNEGWAELAVSPDGRYLAFRSTADDSWAALWSVPTSGGALRELGRFRHSELMGPDELAWTRDGRAVLMMRRTGKDGIPELWRIPAAGGEPQRTGLSMERMGHFSVHPDGRRIAFGTGRGRRQANELWVLENFLTATK